MQTVNLMRLRGGTLYGQPADAPASAGNAAQARASFEELLEKSIREQSPLTVTERQDAIERLLEGYGIYNRGISLSNGSSCVMQASDRLLEFIAAHEGYSATPYRGADAQNFTIGYGHVIRPGENLSYLTREQALELLKKDLSSSIESVRREFGDLNLSQHQFDALVSFAYNLGNYIWGRAPTLTSHIRAGASSEALRADFLRFNRCNGIELEGLTRRRLDEWDLFVNGRYSADF